MSSDRSQWIRSGLARLKPELPGEILVHRTPDGGYQVDYRFDESPGRASRIGVARLRPAGADAWFLEWTSGDGRWSRLDQLARRLDEAIETMARDDFGCFLG